MGGLATITYTACILLAFSMTVKGQAGRSPPRARGHNALSRVLDHVQVIKSDPRTDIACAGFKRTISELDYACAFTLWCSQYSSFVFYRIVPDWQAFFLCFFFFFQRLFEHKLLFFGVPKQTFDKIVTCVLHLGLGARVASLGFRHTCSSNIILNYMLAFVCNVQEPLSEAVWFSNHALSDSASACVFRGYWCIVWRKRCVQNQLIHQWISMFNGYKHGGIWTSSSPLKLTEYSV